MANILYKLAIGSVMYAIICTISYISLLSRFMSNPSNDNWVAFRWQLRYLNGTIYRGLDDHNWAKTFDLVGYVDFNFDGDKDFRQLTTSYFFTIAGNCISQKSQLQPVVAFSITEAVYIAATEAIKKAICIHGLLSEMHLLHSKAMSYTNSQSCLHFV